MKIVPVARLDSYVHGIKAPNSVLWRKWIRQESGENRIDLLSESTGLIYRPGKLWALASWPSMWLECWLWPVLIPPRRGGRCEVQGWTTLHRGLIPGRYSSMLGTQMLIIIPWRTFHWINLNFIKLAWNVTKAYLSIKNSNHRKPFKHSFNLKFPIFFSLKYLYEYEIK